MANQMPGIIPWLAFSGARDKTGAPISSGSAYFYQAHSTSVQIDVYSDDALTPLAQPVALDASGKAVVYIKDPCEIKVLDSTGATEITVTNAATLAAPLVSILWGTSQSTLDAALLTIKAALDAAAAVVIVDSPAISTISTASPVFTFDATKPLNVFKATYAGAMGTLTINGASVAAYSRYRIVIQTGTSSTATATTLPATWKTSSPPTTLASATTYTADFEVATDGHVMQVTPWTVVDGLVW